MQPNNFEFTSKYQLIPVAYAAVMAAVVGIVTHFFKIELSMISNSTSSLITMVGVMLLYSYDLNWMRIRMLDLAEAKSMADVRWIPEDKGVLLINVAAIAVYMILSVLF